MTLTTIKKAKEQGFTIVELLIVIIVIGILATLVLIAYNNVQENARDAKRQADANTLKESAEAYKTTNSTGVYPQGGAGTASGSFYYDIKNSSPAIVAVDSTVTADISTTAPSSSNRNNITVTYCPSGATYSNATGMQFTYWQQQKSPQTNTYTTGTGC